MPDNDGKDQVRHADLNEDREKTINTKSYRAIVNGESLI
jgi:hypothetical protein